MTQAVKLNEITQRMRNAVRTGLLGPPTFGRWEDQEGPSKEIGKKCPVRMEKNQGRLLS